MIQTIILYIVFFISGFCGLCYEILWTREFNLIIGHTTYAISIVLSTFMSGLALGSWLFGRIADKFKSQITLYAYLELAIAGYSLIFYPLIQLYKDVFIYVAPYLNHQFLELSFKLLSSFLIMIIPSTLMGATFPVMSKIVMNDIQKRGLYVGLIYFFNSAGGAVGCIACGFFMLYYLGAEFTLNIVTFLNILCGITAIYLRRYIDTNIDVNEITIHKEEEISTDITSDNKSYSNINLIFIFFLLSGFVSMLLELCWTRFLILIIGSSTYSFSLMLAIFIFFLALGSFITSFFVDKIKDAYLIFGITEFLIGSYITISLPFYEKLPLYFINLNNSIKGPFFIYIILCAIICLFIMAIPALLFGSTFPIAVKAVTMNFSNNATLVGKLYSYNTIGCILGSFFGGILILPLLGFKYTIYFSVIILLSIFLIITITLKNNLNFKIKGLQFITIILLISLYFLPNWDYKILNIGSFYRTNQFKLDNIDTYTKSLDIIYYKEGTQATVCVTKNNNNQKSLKINGKADASTNKFDMLTQQLIGILPCTISDNPYEVLVIGLGCGGTVAALCQFEEIKNITCIEIVPEVIEAAKYFDEFYNIYKNDPRVKIIVNDARSFMLATNKKYDVIISEPSNPWISGIGSLFTVDFFNLMKNKLNDNGVVLLWVHTYETSEEILKLITRTFLSVFEHALVAFNTSHDVYLITKLNDLNFKNLTFPDYPIKCYNKLSQKNNIIQTLKRLELDNILNFLSIWFMTPKQLKVYAENGIINTDNFQTIEYEAPIYLYNKQFIKFDFYNYASYVYQYINHLKTSFTSEVEFNNNLLKLAKFLKNNISITQNIKISILEMLIKNNYLNAEVFDLKSQILFENGEYLSTIDTISKAIEIDPQNIEYKIKRASAIINYCSHKPLSLTNNYLTIAENDLNEILNNNKNIQDEVKKIENIIQVATLYNHIYFFKHNSDMILKNVLNTIESFNLISQQINTKEIIINTKKDIINLAFDSARYLNLLHKLEYTKIIYSSLLKIADDQNKELINLKLENIEYLLKSF